MRFLHLLDRWVREELKDHLALRELRGRRGRRGLVVLRGQLAHKDR